MRLTIKYFGLLAEFTHSSEEQIEFSGKIINDLLEIIYLKYPKLRETDFQIAHDHEIVSKNVIITETEIALLPPFAGG